jgi:hypothetical protein
MRKRAEPEPGLGFRQWKARVDAAKRGRTLDDPTMHMGTARFDRADNVDASSHIHLRRDNDDEVDCHDHGVERRDLSTRSNAIEKRFLGLFGEWVRRVTTLTRTQSGSLPMGLRRDFTLYSGRLRCSNDAGVTITAGLDITTEVSMQMNTMYSYYLSGSIVPPRVDDAYAFVRVQPQITAAININGNAALTYASQRRKVRSKFPNP